IDQNKKINTRYLLFSVYIITLVRKPYYEIKASGKCYCFNRTTKLDMEEYMDYLAVKGKKFAWKLW
ncbi:hypothetical protein ACMUWW_002708, partial [Enterococcus faecium]